MATQKKKTHRGAAKRFKLTANGKLMRGQSGKRHILTKKSRTRKRRLGREVVQGGALGKTSFPLAPGKTRPGRWKPRAPPPQPGVGFAALPA